MAPLRPGMLELGQQKFPLADMVLTIVPEEASQSPVTRVKPHHRRKTRHSLPEDSRAALAWQALNSMKKRGRMALLLPANGLNMNDQVALGQHLVESNLLEAVIRVPACSAARPAKEALLLLVRGARTQTDVAFISPNGLAQGNATLIDADAILQALQAFREGKTHPALLVLPPSVIASQQYQLDVASYAASVTGMTT
jgi:type I restriction-modification system DNA methylase subunit